MLPNYQARSPFMLKHTTSWRASEASETVLGVDNAKSGICYIYLCMYGWYVGHLNARVGTVFLQRTRLFRLDPSLF